MYEILKTLYFADDDKVIDLLRKAIHVKNLDIAGLHVINTGYLFEIHTGTTFELFYNIWDETLVFQPFLPNSIRGFAGLFANSANGKYFDRYGPKAIVKLKNDASEWHEMNIEERDFINNSFTHFFEIYNSENVVIETFNLNKEFPYQLYNSAAGLKKWESDEEYFDDEEY